MLIRLPWPPSVNHFYRAIGRGRVVISDEGREYIDRAGWSVFEQHPKCKRLAGRLSVTIMATMPDKRKRDIDNILKVSIDCLTKSHVWNDDSQIDKLAIERGAVCGPGWLDVCITEIGA